MEEKQSKENIQRALIFVAIFSQQISLLAIPGPRGIFRREIKNKF